MRKLEYGKELPFDQIVGHFKAQEGEANLYYGQMRSGKTYAAVSDIIRELYQGRVVYASFPVKVEDIDDRQSFYFLLRGLLLPWKKRYYAIPLSENFHFINAETGEVDGVKTFDHREPGAYIEYLNSLNHCSIYIDEAWRVLSHTLVDKESRLGSYNLILVTGHKFRTVNLIAQRTMSILPMARANMGRFYRCRKIRFFGINIFLRQEFQAMKGEDVDETVDPISTRWYIGRKRIYQAYNSWFYGDLNPLHALRYTAYDLTYWERTKTFLLSLFPLDVAFRALRAAGSARIRRIWVRRPPTADVPRVLEVTRTNVPFRVYASNLRKTERGTITR